MLRPEIIDKVKRNHQKKEERKRPHLELPLGYFPPIEKCPSKNKEKEKKHNKTVVIDLA
ncbi:hypothetical protein KKA47_06580 [bacterium]|nr:hypothetical protein [bacterium]